MADSSAAQVTRPMKARCTRGAQITNRGHRYPSLATGPIRYEQLSNCGARARRARVPARALTCLCSSDMVLSEPIPARNFRASTRARMPSLNRHRYALWEYQHSHKTREDSRRASIRVESTGHILKSRALT